MDDTKVILVVEDDPTQAAVCEKVLNAGGYRAVSIANPMRLLEELDSTETPALILADVGLPLMDGITLLQRLEGDPRWCVIPAVVMTATPDQDRVVAAQRLPVPPEGFLVKPFKAADLLRLLRTVLEAKEPLYHLRGLQRRRLAAQAGLGVLVQEVEDAFRGGSDRREEFENRMALGRRQIQSLRANEARLGNAPEETREAIRIQIAEIEADLVKVRDEIQKHEGRQKEVVQARQEILARQRQIRDLETKIKAMTTVLQRTGPHHRAA